MSSCLATGLTRYASFRCTIIRFSHRSGFPLIVVYPASRFLDTGAGPNLIRADLLPQDGLNRAMREREIVNLRSASQHRLDALGIVTLTVKIADMTVRALFFIIRQLGAGMLLGTIFIDAHCDIIWIRRRRLFLGNGTWIPVQ